MLNIFFFEIILADSQKRVNCFPFKLFTAFIFGNEGFHFQELYLRHFCADCFDYLRQIFQVPKEIERTIKELNNDSN